MRTARPLSPAPSDQHGLPVHELPEPDSRTRILRAAAQCIAQEGVEGVRMASIAAAAGVSTALLHYHFATKEALFEHVLRHSYATSTSLDLTMTDLRSMRERGLPAGQRLMLYLNRCLPSSPDLTRDLLLWQEFGTMSPRNHLMATVTAEMFEGDVARVAGIIQDGVAAGEFQACDAALVARTVVALCDGLNTRVLCNDPTTTLAEARKVVGSLLGVLLGLSAPLSMEPPPPAHSSSLRRQGHHPSASGPSSTTAPSSTAAPSTTPAREAQS